MVQPKTMAEENDEMRLIIAAKPRRKCNASEVANWEPLFVSGKPEEIDQKMSAPWLLAKLAERSKVVFDSEQTAKEAPATAEKPAPKTKATPKAAKAEASKLSGEELQLTGMVKEAEECLKKKQRSDGMAVFQDRIKPLFDTIKGTMDAALKQRTIQVAKDLMALPEQLEIPE